MIIYMLPPFVPGMGDLLLQIARLGSASSLLVDLSMRAELAVRNAAVLILLSA
jgi:hypothetical protein